MVMIIIFFITNNVTSMSKIFLNATNFNKNINNWNTSNVTNMRSMFCCAKNFNQPLNCWNTNNINDMRYMFIGSSMPKLPNWYNN